MVKRSKKIPRVLSLVKVGAPKEFLIQEGANQVFFNDSPYVFLGELLNVPGCVLAGTSGAIYRGFNAEHFDEVNE